MSASTIFTIASFHCGTSTNVVAEEVWSIKRLAPDRQRFE